MKFMNFIKSEEAERDLKITAEFLKRYLGRVVRNYGAENRRKLAY